VLLAATVAVYKPWGMTGYGRRKQYSGVLPGSNRKTITWNQLLLLGAIGLVLLLLVLHLIGGGPRNH
jgi:hypothetical protein